MAIRYKNVSTDYSLCGRFTTAANFLTDRGGASATEGDMYYNTTSNTLMCYDGTNWSAAGLNSQSAGSLNDAASIGGTITVDGSTVAADFAVTVSDGGDDVCATFTQNDVTNNGKGVLLVNTGTGVTLDFASSGTYDIQGTGDVWDVSAAGAAHFTAVAVDADEDIELGATTNGDVRFLFHDGAVGTAGNGLLLDALGANEQLQIGDATYTFDVWFVGETATTNFMKWDFDGGADSVGALVFANADIDMGDDDAIRLGGSQDFVISYNSADLVFTPAANNDGLIFGTTSAAVDIKAYGDTATSILQWYSAGDRLVFASAATSSDPMCQFDDYAQVTFGAGASNFGTSGTGDVQLEWDTTNFNMTAAAANSPWKIGGASTGFDITYSFETAGTIATDYDADVMIFEGGSSTVGLRLNDSDRLLFGDAATPTGTSDGYMYWDNSNSRIHVAGNVNMAGAVTAASLTVTGTLTHTGSYAPTSFAVNDDQYLNFGTSSDFQMKFVSASNYLDISAGTGQTNSPVTFGGAGADTDVRFCGTTSNYDARWDASRNHLLFQDNAVLGFGGTASAAADYKVYTAGSTGNLIITAVTSNDCVAIGDGTTATDFLIDNITNAGSDLWWDQSADGAAGTLYFGKDNKGFDVKFFGEAASAYLLWDQDGNTNGCLIASGGTTIDLEDNVELLLGSGSSNAGDFKLYSDGTSVFLKEISAAGKAMEIGQDNKGIDVKFYGEAASAYLLWDQNGNTNGSLIAEGVDIQLMDDDILRIGDGSDITVAWDQTQLNIDGAAADKNIRIGYTNNQDVSIYAGTTNANVVFDTDDSAKTCTFEDFDLKMMDDDIISFGDAADISITWDKTQLNIDGAAADKNIRLGYANNQDLTIYAGTTNANVCFDTDDGAKTCTFEDFDLKMMDDDIISFGDAADISVVWDKTQLNIDGAAADKNIRLGYTNNQDLSIYAATTNANIVFDTDDSAKTCTFEDFDLKMMDDDVISFGDALDITIQWDTTDLHIDAAAANSQITVGETNIVDLLLNGNTAGADVHWDATADTLGLLDDAILGFGNTAAAPDITIEWDQTRLNVDGANADTVIRIGYTNNQDIEIYGDSTNDSVIFNTSDEKCDFDGFDLDMNDDDILSFGDAADITIAWDKTQLNIDGAAADKNIRIGFTNNQDVSIYGDSTNDSVVFDTDSEMCTFNGFDLTMNDADLIKFGDSGAEATIASDGTNTNLTVVSGTLDIGDGGTTNYTSFDSTGDITQVGSANLSAFRRKVTAKTGDYSVLATDSGTIFTNYGAGVAVNFTLPAKATGLFYTFYCAADNSITITADAADTLCCFDDAACDSVAYSTAGDKLGGSFDVFTDGNLWYVMPHTFGDGVATQTISQAT